MNSHHKFLEEPQTFDTLSAGLNIDTENAMLIMPAMELKKLGLPIIRVGGTVH